MRVTSLDWRADDTAEVQSLIEELAERLNVDAGATHADTLHVRTAARTALRPATPPAGGPQLFRLPPPLRTAAP